MIIFRPDVDDDTPMPATIFTHFFFDHNCEMVKGSQRNFTGIVYSPGRFNSIVRNGVAIEILWGDRPEPEHTWSDWQEMY